MDIKRKRKTLNARVIADLKKRSYLGMVYYLIALMCVIFPDGYYLRDPHFSWLFLGLVFFICLFRFLHSLISIYLPSRFKRMDFNIFAASIVLNALIWGLGFARVLGQEGEQNTHLLMLISTIGICSGGVVSFAPLLWLSIVYNTLILLPGTIYMAVVGNYLSLAGLCLLFCSYLVFLAAKINGEYWKALENEWLLEQKSRELEKISNMDGLTGLFNRRYFDTVFEVEWRHAVRNQTRIALIICDIDRFKQVNDCFGHMAGDEYLKLTAGILKRVFKRKTDILVRYGGEEFVVLISEVSVKQAAELAERLRKEMEKAILEFESREIRTTVSLGVAAVLPQPSDQRELLISKADDLLYLAKNRGRNQVAVEEAQD